MTGTLKTALLVSAGVAFASTGAHAAHMAYSLGNGGSTLVSFGAGSPDMTEGVGITSQGENLSLDAITYRPETGELWGYSAQNDAFYTVNAMTGAASLAYEADIDLPSGNVSLDFNPTLDAVRLVTSNRDNIVYFPGDSRDGMGRQDVLTTAPTDLFYDDGYTSNAPPQIVGNGYTNQIGYDAAQGTGTTQYVLDGRTDTIGILNNNAGDVDFVANAGFNFTGIGGVDVFTDPDGNNIGYALLSGQNGSEVFYEIDLTSFVFTAIGSVDTNGFGQLRSLAVFLPETASEVPIPAAGLLFMAGAGGLAAARRRRKEA